MNAVLSVNSQACHALYFRLTERLCVESVDQVDPCLENMYILL